LAPRDPSAPAAALLVFPEDVGLVAGLIGSRGALARQVTADTGGSTLAFLALTVAYQPLVEHYSEEFPGLPGLAYIVPGATDCFTARLIEEAGFPVVYVTGGGTANTYLGGPDIGLVTLNELASQVEAGTTRSVGVMKPVRLSRTIAYRPP